MTKPTWFITGTSSGFGRLLTEELLARGNRVAATARRPGTLDDLAAAHGDRLWRAELDVTDPGAVERVVARAFDELGRIDVLASNAGSGMFGAAEEVGTEDVQRLVGTNLVGAIELIRAFLPRLRAQGGGRILQVSSKNGQTATPGMAVYCATKWGIEGFCEALAKEVAGFGIEVTLVQPGVAATGFGGAGFTMAPALAAYAPTMLGAMRKVMSGDVPPPPGMIPGDPHKMVRAIIDCAEEPKAPLRLTLGSDAYDQVTGALRGRLSALEAQQELAYSTDLDEIQAARA
jgi:NAD(P)-dependent dehydrogenase (short-subunit alcohol dehydrogenase family)